MAFPVGLQGVPGPLQAYLAELEDRVAGLETPQGFQRLFKLVSTSLTSTSAQANAGTWALATDLKTFVWSDGAHWYRTDTGAVIV